MMVARMMMLVEVLFFRNMTIHKPTTPTYKVLFAAIMKGSRASRRPSRSEPASLRTHSIKVKTRTETRPIRRH